MTELLLFYSMCKFDCYPQKSGLVPKYLKKKVGPSYSTLFFLCYSYNLSHVKEYGEVPAYLKQREQEMTEAQAEYDRLVKESLEKEAMAQLNDSKRFNGFTLCVCVCVCVCVCKYDVCGVCVCVCVWCVSRCVCYMKERAEGS